MPGTVQYAEEEHEGLRRRVENDISIKTTAEAYLKALATENYLKTKMAMADPPLQTYSPFNSDFQPSRFRAERGLARDMPRAARDVLVVQETGLAGDGQQGSRREEERRKRLEREQEEKRQDEDFEREEKQHRRRMEEREQEQAERRKRQLRELEKEEEQNQAELRDERLRAQTAREEATLREMRLVTGAAEAERRTAEIELREVQERLRSARQGEEADVYAVMDGPEVAMSYVPEGAGGGGRFGGGQGGGYRGAAYQEQGYRAGDSAWERGGGRGQPWREGQYSRDTRA
jgi:hypothetical protein